jgi:hypothetical protein
LKVLSKRLTVRLFFVYRLCPSISGRRSCCNFPKGLPYDVPGQAVEGGRRPVTREEIEKRMDELARKYVETHDRDIIEELNRLSRQLQELEKHFRR